MFKRLRYPTVLSIKDIDNITADEISSAFDSAQNRFTSSATETARTAALNEMMKKYMQAFNDDLQAQYVRPGLEATRRSLMSRDRKRLGVGILQKTSVLASNRLVARVDPVATASLQADKQEEGGDDALQATLQLAQIAAAVSSGGTTLVPQALSALTQSLGTSAQPKGIIGSLPFGSNTRTMPNESVRDNKSTKDKEKEKQGQPGIYSLTTGNVFQVTPVFDPTGQALRFRFDYVAQSAIREPNNTVDPQLPRIERHGVNTEVHLSNNEIRLISQYESNARIGKPSSKWGGVPVLNQLWPFREIPVVGWFTKRQRDPGTVMESLIFAQTNMYPLIDDVIALMTRPTVGVDTGAK